jgi:hypothetical protein
MNPELGTSEGVANFKIDVCGSLSFKTYWMVTEILIRGFEPLRREKKLHGLSP